MLIKLPFDGFYESIHDSNIDYAIESLFQDEQGDSHVPESFWDKYDGSNVRIEYSKLFVEQVQQYLQDECNLFVNLTFESMTSPKFYNYETDIIYCELPVQDVIDIWKLTDKARLSKVAIDRHTSRSGFISFYDNDVESWGDVTTWDHNQLETLLIAWADYYGDCELMDEQHESIESLVYDNLNAECKAMVDGFDYMAVAS